MVSSKDPETIRVPSGENDTEETALLCPRNAGNNVAPEVASQTQTVLSSDPETMRVPSGENATDRKGFSCTWIVSIKEGQNFSLDKHERDGWMSGSWKALYKAVSEGVEGSAVQ